MDERFAQWARETAIYIRFRPDRIDVARELAQHMEDKCAVLEGCGYEHDLAAERAVEAMGDPETVGRALDRAHRPGLGWLWLVSKAAVILAAILAVWALFSVDNINGTRREADPDLDREGYAAYGAWLDPSNKNPDSSKKFLGYGTVPTPVETSGYTLSIPYSAWWEDEDDACWVDFVLAADTDRPWNKAPWSAALDMAAADSFGNIYPSFRKRYGMAGIDLNELEYGQKYFHFVYALGVPMEQRPEWVELHYPHGDNDWTLRIYLEEAGT